MSCKSGPSVAYAETKARNSCLKSATASGHTRGSKHLNAHLGQRQSSSHRVRGLFLAPACVQASFSAADEKLALDMYRRGVSMEQITRAILLGCARKYVAMLNAGTRTPITSLQYFADIVEEVKESAIPESYWEPLRSKMARMEQQWQKGHQARP